MPFCQPIIANGDGDAAGGGRREAAAACASVGQWEVERPAMHSHRRDKTPNPHWDPRGERAASDRAPHTPD